MNKILFLDDNVLRWEIFYKKFYPNEIKWVENSHECIEELKTNEYILVYLDHDLGAGEGDQVVNCGMEVIRWIEANIERINKDIQFIIHSWNIPASEKMCNKLQKLGLKCKRVPFKT
jgi:hypothetical protein